jgi:hypothetical protein
VTEVAIDELRRAVRTIQKCDSAFVESVPVVEAFQGETVWEGAVVVFDLIDHPTAKRAYAWSSELPGGKRREFTVVLHAGPVDSPVAAVRLAIAAGYRGKTGH